MLLHLAELLKHMTLHNNSLKQEKYLIIFNDFIRKLPSYKFRYENKLKKRQNFIKNDKNLLKEFDDMKINTNEN